MPTSWDDELVKTTDESAYSPPPKRPIGPWIVVAVLIAATAVAAYLFFRGTPAPTETTTAEAPAPAPAIAPEQPLGADADPIELPPLDQSDATVRELVRQLSSHPQVAAWLATDGLIRNFTLVVTNIADGKTPAAQLKALKPAAPFAVNTAGDDLHIDPRSYERYTGIAAAVTSIDPAGSARLYTLLKPRIEEASAELGNQGTSFDSTLERAIVRLLETPIPDGPLRVTTKGATGYQYDNALLEALPAAQKQLLRMGPQNARMVQDRLRQIAQALNIPADRLPPRE